MTILLKNTLYTFHGLFFRRFHAIQFIFFAHCHPFMFAQLMIGQQFDFFDITHIAGKLAQAMRGIIVVRPAGNDNVTDPDLHIFL
ncbi:Uncharacterised protein [Salmonella enterica subsp. enterica serovar Bovismorbificans]|uniref:Uncharacterized protein n=1 Tax=Salmonella enterica subsp. enterica serovar Bovismorbificans TaxID=58097 RepID=A0A655DMD6_SALET|nr:Uncharacterised protein [Salmonella enterica subsp. enterica serovar Bovismorbificans]